MEDVNEDEPLKWGDSFDKLSDERKQELRERLLAWTPEQATMERPGPFVLEALNGLEVFWLAACAVAGKDRDPIEAARRLVAFDFDEEFPLRGSAFLHLECAILNGAYLQHAGLFLAWLTGTSLEGAQLSGANFAGAHMEGTNLSNTQLSGAVLAGAQLNHANLSDAHLEDVNASRAQLVGADLHGSYLKGASLRYAQLEESDLRYAHLGGTDLRQATFNKKTRLNQALLTGILLDQASFDDTNLTIIDWELVPKLGDELEADTTKDSEGKLKPQSDRVNDYAAATRAYLSLATALQSQGLGESADRYAFRSKIMRRKQLRYQKRYGSYLISGFWSLSAGYGYRIRRVVGAYLFVVTLFAIAFLLAGLSGSHTPFNWQAAADAAQISLNAIHGRVFFAQFHLDTLQSWLATTESIIGIVIEGVFVAALIQRLFSR